MPRPLPPYVPPSARELLEQRKWGLKALAERSDLGYMHVVHLFKDGKHPSLRTFTLLCSGLDISIEYGAKILEQDATIRSRILDRRIRRRFGTYENCAEACSLSVGYLYDLVGGKSGGADKILDVYKPIGDALGVPLSEVGATIFGAG